MERRKMRIKLSQSDWKEIGRQMGWMKAAQTDIRSARLALMARLKGIAAGLDPRVVPYLTNIAAANGLVVAASPKMDNPAVGQLLGQMEALDREFMKGMPAEERGPTMEAFRRAVDTASRGAAEIAAGLTPAEAQRAELRRAQATKAVNNAAAYLSFAAGAAATGLGAGAMPATMGGLQAVFGTDSTDVGGDMGSMARQQAEERYGEEALERVRRDKAKLLRERAAREQLEGLEGQGSGGGG